MDIDSQEGHRPRTDRRTRTIPTMCRIHGISGFSILRVATVDGGDMEHHPHGNTSGGGVGCVSVLTEGAANTLFDALGEWLG